MRTDETGARRPGGPLRVRPRVCDTVMKENDKEQRMGDIYRKMHDEANRQLAGRVNKESEADNCVSRFYYHVRGTMAGGTVRDVYDNKDAIDKRSR